MAGPRSCCLTGAGPGDLAETGGSELETSQWIRSAMGLGQEVSPGRTDCVGIPDCRLRQRGGSSGVLPAE